MNSNEKTHFLFNMESSPRGIKASRKGVWWMFSFYLNWILWLKPYKTGWKWVLSLNVVFQTFPNQFFGGTITLGNSQKNSVIVFNIVFIAIHLFEVTKLQFYTGWLLGVHGSNCCIPLEGLQRSLRSFLLPSTKLRWHPRTSGSYYFTGGKLRFGEQLFDFKTEGAVKKTHKKPNLPTNCPHHLGALVVIVCQTSTK